MECEEDELGLKLESVGSVGFGIASSRFAARVFFRLVERPSAFSTCPKVR